MHIAFFGKFPPIQGGTSQENCSIAKSILVRGHSLSCFTNAFEADAHIRTSTTLSDLQNFLPNSLIYSTQPVEDQSYVPWSKPYLTQLLGVGSKQFQKRRPDVIYGSYFEPYGLAAAILGKEFNIPVVIKPSGSDLIALSSHPDLGSSYRYFFKDVSAVISNKSDVQSSIIFEQLGLKSLLVTSSYTLDDIYFSKQNSLDFSDLFSIPNETIKSMLKELDNDCFILSQIELLKNIEKRKIIVSYGKVHQQKGSYHLLNALEMLFAYESTSSNATQRAFVTIPCGSLKDIKLYIKSLLLCPHLSKNCLVLPPLSPWLVPRLLAKAHVVTFLEDEFLVQGHTSQIPLEAWAAGCVLVISKNYVGRQVGRSIWVNKKNCYLVDQISDQQKLAQILRMASENTEENTYIAALGRSMVKSLFARKTGTTIVDILEAAANNTFS